MASEYRWLLFGSSNYISAIELFVVLTPACVELENVLVSIRMVMATLFRLRIPIGLFPWIVLCLIRLVMAMVFFLGNS